MHLVEQVGSGIGRIQKLMKDSGLPQPEFFKEGMFTLILNRSQASSGQISEKAIPKSREKILNLIHSRKEITMAEMAMEIGVSAKAIEKHIAQLKQEGRLERIGPDKGGYRKIIKQ